MSIWKELYEIFANERSRLKQGAADTQSLHFEIQSNMIFIHDALRDQLSQAAIIKSLQHTCFDGCIADGFNFNSLCRRKVTKKTVGDYTEFKRYIGKDSAWLIKNAYLRIKSLKQLSAANSRCDYSLKLKSLLRFLIFINAHLEGQSLSRR